MSSLLAIGFSVSLLLVRGVSSLAAPALVLLLFAFPPATPSAVLTSAPVAFAVLLLALAALADFCADLVSSGAVLREERPFLHAVWGRGRPVVEGLIRLERTARWKKFRRRGEWLFVPLWLAAALWIHDKAALPLVVGAGAGVLLILFFAALTRLDGEQRERRIADGALRAATSLGLAHRLGRAAAFVERSLARHRRARRGEQSLAVIAAACLLCLRLSAAATLVLLLLYALSLVGDKQANLGEVVAILLLLRSVFFWLEQRACSLAFYAPQERRLGAFLSLASATQHSDTATQHSDTHDSEEDKSVPKLAPSAEGVSAPPLQVEQGEVVPGGRILLTCNGLVLQRGEAVVVSGESGGGKSLLLKACAGQVSSKGFRVLGEPVRIDNAPLAGVCYVPQEACLLDGTLGENITAFDAHPDEARATKLLLWLGAERTLAFLPEGLATRTDPFDARLPHAFKVQVLLAAALYGNPRLLLCDAGVDALDAKGIERFARVLQNFCKEGAALVATKQSALVQVCRQVWICADSRVQVRALKASDE